MLSPHPLNQAVIAQALHDLRNGNVCRCRFVGFTPKALEALKHPEIVSMLINAKVPWVSVKINLDVLQRLLERGRDLDSEMKTIDRMLELGASTDMVSEFYGLTHEEIALRRDMLGLPKRKGRWPVLTEAQDVRLWEEWKSLITTRGLSLKGDGPMLHTAMDLARSLDLPLSVVWNAITEWIAQGMT